MPSVHLRLFVFAALSDWKATRAIVVFDHSGNSASRSCSYSCLLSGSNPSPDCLYFYCPCNTDVHFLPTMCSCCPIQRPILRDLAHDLCGCEPVGVRPALLCPAPTGGGGRHPYPIHCAPAKFLSYAPALREVPWFGGLTAKDSAGNPPELSDRLIVLPETQTHLNNISPSSAFLVMNQKTAVASTRGSA